jgi:hypothetical protein
MNDSGRRSDLFRRGGVIAPLRCAPASPSSRFLASSKNLCRGQSVSGDPITEVSQEDFDSVSRACFGRVSMNNPG